MRDAPKAMSAEECWRRLGERGIGRIAFNAGRGPRVHPVNYAVEDRHVYVRTAEDSELGHFARMFAEGSFVGFEADQVDESRGEGWSVLVTARVQLMNRDDPAFHQARVPLAGGTRDDHLKLTPIEVTGRRLPTTHL